MEIDEGQLDLGLVFEKLNSNLWYMKVEGYESLLKEIIDYEPSKL